MAKLQNFNGKFCESEYEQAFLSYLQEEGWKYLAGTQVVRHKKRAVLVEEDLKTFLAARNPDLTKDEIQEIMDKIRLVGSESDFATLHKVYGWMVNGIQFTPKNGRARMVNLIDFENHENNIFRAVNQFTVEYTNNGKTKVRIPDILLFVNGLPLCIIELKNPSESNAPFSMLMSKLQFAIGGIFLIFYIIVL